MQPADNRQNGRRGRSVAQALAWPRRFQPTFDISLVDWHGWLSRGLAREVEQRRLFPWLAVCFGAGILLFFQAEANPALWAPLTGAALFGGLAIAFRSRLAVLAMCVGLAMVFAGFAAGILRT